MDSTLQEVFVLGWGDLHCLEEAELLGCSLDHAVDYLSLGVTSRAPRMESF